MRTTEETIKLMNDLLDKFEEANDRFDRGEWSKKYSERLKPYEVYLKRFNGDDFDAVNESYEEYHHDYKDKISDDEYMDTLENKIKRTLEKVYDKKIAELISPEVAEIASDAAEAAKTVSDNPEASTETHIEVSDENKDGSPEIETHSLEDLTSDSNSKTRYQKRSESNKNKLSGWDPQKRLGSDEEIKEEVDEEEIDPMEEFQKSLDEEYAKSHRK